MSTKSAKLCIGGFVTLIFVAIILAITLPLTLNKNNKEEKIPDDNDIGFIVSFNTPTHGFLDNPCHLETSLEKVNIGITSNTNQFDPVDLYCQKDGNKRNIATFFSTVDQLNNINLSTCDSIFLKARGDEQEQDHITISRAKNDNILNSVELGASIDLGIKRQCRNALTISRCESFGRPCEIIKLPYIYTDLSNDNIHFEIVDRNNQAFYEQITLAVLPVENVSSDINVHMSGFENHVLLENLVISPSNKNNNWEITTILQYEDSEINIILKYDSNKKTYTLIREQDEYFKEGTYKLLIDNHEYKFQISAQVDFGQDIKTFLMNPCHIENSLNTIDFNIAVDKFVNEDVLLMCNDEVIETWKHGDYHLTKNLDMSACEHIYLKTDNQTLGYKTDKIDIKLTTIDVPDEILFKTAIALEYGIEECKDAFIMYGCENDECVEITTFPHVNEYTNDEYYSIIGVLNEHEYLRLHPVQTTVGMGETKHISLMKDNMRLDTLSIEPKNPNSAGGYDVKVDHVIDDVLIEVLDGILIPIDDVTSYIDETNEGYDLILKDKPFENGKYVVNIGSAKVEFDVELLASFDKNIKSAVRNTCFGPLDKIEYTVNIHEDIETDVYHVCQKDGTYTDIEQIINTFDNEVDIKECDLIFLTLDPHAQDLIKYDELIPRSSDITIEPIIEERLLGHDVILSVKDMNCSYKDFVLEKCIVDGECTEIELKWDEHNHFIVNHPLKHFQYNLKSGNINHASFTFVPVTTIILDNNNVILTDNGNGILLKDFVVEPVSLKDAWDIDIKVKHSNVEYDATLQHDIIDNISTFKVNLKDEKLFKFGEYTLVFEHDEDYKTTEIDINVDLEFDESTRLFLSNECHLVDSLDNIPMSIINDINNGYLICVKDEEVVYTLPITRDSSTMFNLNPCDNVYISAIDTTGRTRTSEVFNLEKTSFVNIPLYDKHTLLFGSTINYSDDASQTCINNLVLEQYKFINIDDVILFNYEIGTGYLDSSGDDFMMVIKGSKNDFEYKKIYYKSERVQYIHVANTHNNAGDKIISPFHLNINTPLQDFYWHTPLHLLWNEQEADVMLTYNENGYVLEAIGDYRFEMGHNVLNFPGNRAVPFVVNDHPDTYNLVICVLDNENQKICDRNFENILELSTYYIELQNNIMLPSDYTIKIFTIVDEDDAEFLQYVNQNDQLELLPGSYRICAYDDMDIVFRNSCVNLDVIPYFTQFSETTINAIPNECLIDQAEYNIPIQLVDIFKRPVSIVCTKDAKDNKGNDVDVILRETVYDDYEDTTQTLNIGHCTKLFILLQNEEDLGEYQDVLHIKQFYLDYDDNEDTMYFGRVFDVELTNTCVPKGTEKILFNGQETSEYQVFTFKKIDINIKASINNYVSISKTHKTRQVKGISVGHQFFHICECAYVIIGNQFKVNVDNELLNIPNPVSDIIGLCTRENRITYEAMMTITPDGRFTLRRSDIICEAMTHKFKFTSQIDDIDIVFDVSALQSGVVCN